MRPARKRGAQLTGQLTTLTKPPALFPFSGSAQRCCPIGVLAGTLDLSLPVRAALKSATADVLYSLYDVYDTSVKRKCL